MRLSKLDLTSTFIFLYFRSPELRVPLIANTVAMLSLKLDMGSDLDNFPLGEIHEDYPEPGYCPLDMSLIFNRIDKVRFLLKNGADPHKCITVPISPECAILLLMCRRNQLPSIPTETRPDFMYRCLSSSVLDAHKNLTSVILTMSRYSGHSAYRYWGMYRICPIILGLCYSKFNQRRRFSVYSVFIK